MSVLLGLDLGEKRVGVAVSDESGMLAMPFATLAFSGRKDLLSQLVKIVDEHRVTKIIVGLPKTVKGEIGPSAEKVMKKVEWLKGQLDRPWIFWDERLSTAEVERILIEADVRRDKRKQVRDQLAAQRILQSYLDYERSQT